MDNTLTFTDIVRLTLYQHDMMQGHIMIQVSNNTHENWNCTYNTDPKIQSFLLK